MRGFLALAWVSVGLLLANAVALDVTQKQRSSADEVAWARNPVGKVVMLLRDMAKQLDADADREEELDDTMHCWCKTNDAERSKAVKDNTQRKDQMSTLREELTGKSAQLNQEISDLEKELGKNNRALDTAIALRKKELAEFNSAEVDMISSIASLKNAQKALGMNNPAAAAMLQNNTNPIMLSVREAIKKHHDMLWSTFSSKDENKLKVLSMLLGRSRTGKTDKAFLQQPASGEVIGIIGGMTESFEKNLESLRSSETKDVDSHKSLKKAKETEIAAGQAMLDDKVQEIAATDERSAKTMEDIEDTTRSIAADSAFVADLRERCASHKDEYAMRVKTRQLEIDGVNKALEFLTGDEARDLFTRTFGSSKNPEGGKLGSRNLDKHEERSGKYSGSGSRGFKHGKHSGLFLQLSMVHNSAPNATQKLAVIAQKTGAYWSSKYWLDKKAEDAKLEAKRDAKLHRYHDKKTAPFAPKAKVQEKRNKLGLTSSQMTVRNDKMGAIGKAMDKQIQAMQLQQQNDVKKKAFCVDEIHNTEREMDIERRAKADIEEKMGMLEQRMKELAAEMKELKKEQDEQNSELGMAAHDRKKANKEYQNVVGDQQATEKLLKQALQVLEAVYKNKAKKASLIRQKYAARADQAQVQAQLLRAATSVFGGDSAVAGVDLDFSHARQQAVTSQKYETAGQRHRRGVALGLKLPKNMHAPWKVVAVPHTNPYLAALNTGTKLGYEPPPPPPTTGFAAHSNNRQSGGVTTMIQNLISDAQAMIAEAVKGEGDSLIAYEGYVGDWDEATTARQKAIVNRKLEYGRVEKDFIQAEATFKDIVEEIARLRQYDIDLYGVQGCEFMLKNFAVRYVARMEEINGLKVAKVVLTSGGGGGEDPAAATDGVEKVPAELLSKNKGSMYTSVVPKLPAKHTSAKPKAAPQTYGTYPDVRA